jgi:hypothetical protein
MMYLRFVVADLDKDSGKELGIFHAMGRLRNSGQLHDFEDEHYEFIREWFNKHLEKPARFTASKPPYYRKQQKAISWFRDTAREHLDKVRELVVILQNHGIVVETLITDRVGYVVYEDKYQIVAEPFTGESY